jgi:hypothetical protein
LENSQAGREPFPTEKGFSGSFLPHGLCDAGPTRHASLSPYRLFFGSSVSHILRRKDSAETSSRCIDPLCDVPVERCGAQPEQGISGIRCRNEAVGYTSTGGNAAAWSDDPDPAHYVAVRLTVWVADLKLLESTTWRWWP